MTDNEISAKEYRQKRERLAQALGADALPTEEEIRQRSAADKAKGSLIERLEAAKERGERTDHAPNLRKSTGNTIVVQIPENPKEPVEQSEDGEQAFIGISGGR